VVDIFHAAVEAAWLRSGARCECASAHHAHGARRCGARLEWVNRGRHGEGAWEIHREGTADEGAGETVAAFCWDCHAKDI
jgi:hypothetical protein